MAAGVVKVEIADNMAFLSNCTSPPRAITNSRVAVLQDLLESQPPADRSRARGCKPKPQKFLISFNISLVEDF